MEYIWKSKDGLYIPFKEKEKEIWFKKMSLTNNGEPCINLKSKSFGMWRTIGTKVNKPL